MHTRDEAFRSIQDSLGERQQEVLRTIKWLGGATLFELVEHLEKPINQISGRVTELHRKGLIITKSERINPNTGRSCAVWIAKEKNNGN